jgi:hypothetical protein
VANALVEVTGASGFSGTTSQTTTWSMTTDADGCFAIHSASAPKNQSPTCPHIGDEDASGAPPVDTGGAPPPVDTETTLDGQIIRLLSDVVTVKVSGASLGFSDLVTGKQTLGPGTITDFSLSPQPVLFVSGSGTNTLDVRPTTDTPDWSQAHVTVAEVDGLAHGITVSLVGSGSEAVLTWHDPNLQTNQVQPGTYALTATLPGYQTATTTLTCTAGSPGTCMMSPPSFTLTKLATLTMTSQDADGPVDGATFTLTDNGKVVGTPVTAASDSDTLPPFTGLTPGDANLRVAIQAAGHRFTTANALNYTLVCDGAAVTSIPAPAAGATVACTATLERLGSISGTVTGIQAISPATSPNSPIGGATVTIKQCDTVVDGPDGTPYCTARTSGGKSFTTTAAASTDASPGTFTITGTNTLEGLTAGAWLITATAPGYCPAATPANAVGDCPATLPATVVDQDGNNQTPLGIAVQLATDNTDANQLLTLYQRPARLVVTATAGGKPAIGLTLTLSGNNLDAAVQATEETDKNQKLTGTYDFPPEVPGPYNLTATGDGFLTTGQQVPVAVGAPPFPLTMSRGTNTVTGTVTGLQNTDVTANDLSGVTVCIVGTASGTCSDSNDVLSGVDGTALTTTTGDDGTFAFTTNVPDTPAKSSYFIRAEKYGYVSFISAAFTVKHTGPATHDEQIPMNRVTWKVVVTVTASTSTDDLSSAGGTDATFTSVAGGNTPDTAPTNSDRPETASADPSSKKSFTVTDAQVPFGCWTLDYVLSQVAGDHFGTLSKPTAPLSDSALNCPNTAFTVPGTPPPGSKGETEVDVAYTLNEAELDLSVAATALAPDTVPAIEVTATNSKSTVVYDHTFDAVSDTSSTLTPTIWVPKDTYTVAAAVSPASTGWTTDSQSASVPGTSPPESATLALNEKKAELDVAVSGAGANKKAWKVTVTCIDSQTVPKNCDTAGPSGTDSGSGVQFKNLAPGTWHVEAVLSSDATNVVTEDVTLTAGKTKSITLPNANSTPTNFPPPPPPPSTPAPTSTP